jgi:chromosome segregation ATPase
VLINLNTLKNSRYYVNLTRRRNIMKRIYRIFVLVMFLVFALNGTLLAERAASIEEREQVPIPELERRELAEQLEMMNSRSAELREAAMNAEKQGHHEEARELHEKAGEFREQAMRLAEQIEMHAREIKQRRLREIDECLDRLRQITHEAEEIRERMGHGIEQLERERIFPLPELPMEPESLRPGLQRQWENMQNVIGQVREAFMRHLERIEATVGRFRNNMEQMERQIHELRAQNERLRNQLREKDEIIRRQERIITEQRADRERRERLRSER